MSKFFSLILILLPMFAILNSCGYSHEEIQTRVVSGDYDIYAELPFCDCGDLSTNDAGVLITQKQEAYTGTCSRNYPETEKVMEERQILNGKLYGYVSIYDMEGNLMTKTLYKDGILLSARGENAITCSCKELTDYTDTLTGIKYKIYNSQFFTGTCENFYADSTLALKAEYREGLNHGILTVYDKNGEAILTEKYDEGELID